MNRSEFLKILGLGSTGLIIPNIGLALWIGEVLGYSYCGFFVVAAFYLLLALLIYWFRNQWIKNPVSNFIISQSLKKN